MRKRGDEWETPDAVENDDGGLSAPLMYASLVLGMITVWKKDRDLAMESFEGEGVGRDGGSVPAEQAPAKRLAVWSEKVRFSRMRKELGGFYVDFEHGI